MLHLIGKGVDNIGKSYIPGAALPAAAAADAHVGLSKALAEVVYLVHDFKAHPVASPFADVVPSRHGGEILTHAGAPNPAAFAVKAGFAVNYIDGIEAGAGGAHSGAAAAAGAVFVKTPPVFKLKNILYKALVNIRHSNGLLILAYKYGLGLHVNFTVAENAFEIVSSIRAHGHAETAVETVLALNEHKIYFVPESFVIEILIAAVF